MLLAGRYNLGSKIGEGAFAEVFEATDQRGGTTCAVKLLKVALGGRHAMEARRRFVREAELAGSLSHPDIVAIYDIGVAEDGRLFMVLERLHGRTLEALLDEEGPMNLPRAQRLMVGALTAIQVAHERDMIHRDLKPSNLFIEVDESGNERMRILDFGLAYVREYVGSRVSQNGQINGTAAYLAPEYVEKELVTPTIDVYQMGLIFAEMISGRPAVHSLSPIGCLAKHMSGELELPLDRLGPACAAVLKKAVAVNHEQRYRDAGEFRDALIAAMGASPDLYISSSKFEVRVNEPGAEADNETSERGRHAPPARPTRPTRPTPPPTRRVNNLAELLANDEQPDS